MDSALALRWNTRSRRSKRPRPPPPHADEYAAAMSLILLSESGGGFCCTTASDRDPTIPSPPKKSITNPSGLIIRIKRQRVESPDTPLPNPTYACWMCDKVFTCSQALGGHMTLHRQKKGKSVAVAVAVAVSDDHNSGRVHECWVCHEAFDSGQALGGHMRKHFDKSKLARRGAGGESSSDSSTSGATARPIFMFDLNLPALEEEED